MPDGRLSNRNAWNNLDSVNPVSNNGDRCRSVVSSVFGRTAFCLNACHLRECGLSLSTLRDFIPKEIVLPTALVVDDSATDRHLVGGLLAKDSRWNVVYANDGIQALIQLDLQDVDVVVADLLMPKMNGRELVEAVKNRSPLVPVVLITDKGSEQIAGKALQFGAASYLPKKNISQELLTTLNRVLATLSADRSEAQLMRRMVNNEFGFVLKNDWSLSSYVLAYLQQVSSMLFDENDRVRVAIAVEEALLNAYYHGSLEVSSELHESAYQALVKQRREEPPYCNRKVFVDAKYSPTQAVIVVRDEGPGFNSSQIPNPADSANVTKVYGRGCFLMQMYMDEVTYMQNG